MATPSHSLIFVFLCLPAVLVKANILGDIYPCPCKCSQENETSLHMYLHQFPALPGVPNRNEYGMINSTEPIGFGQMYVHDWLLTIGTSANENVVGRLQGFHLQAGQTTTSWYMAHTMVFSDGSFAGSTIEVSGLLGVKPNGQWSITGGTGTFASAHGTIKFMNSQSSTATDDIRELDIHVFHTPEAVV
ncbi:hypothetical protein OsI_28925 [Oryza sativa Indica Group]|uniref:Dirigent protein n=1 Tax=Oryza sativa subsp. indica TaxID=39946 RepID=A2YUB8_ORYSI|nr:hypothetical protein OsI_28925 [Oryza sativa Indica Group]